MSKFSYDIQVSDQKTIRTLNIVAYILSAVVLSLVVLMRRIKIDLGVDFGFLPAVYSILNALTACILIVAYRAIRKKDVHTHKLAIFWAVGLSALFLLLYVLYHITTPETLFCKEGFIRYIYFFFLITHVVLAAVIFPFILFTLVRAITGQLDRHKKMARWVWPIWFYVAVTGPVCYLFLYPCYS